MDRADRRRRAKEDAHILTRGIDPASNDPAPTAAMARMSYSLIEASKKISNIDLPVEFLYSKITSTIGQLRNIPIACKKGCAHCCYIWVSATAPEIIYISKIIRRRGDGAIARVIAANEATKDFDIYARKQHPTPCPMLNENACSIYDSRPGACRLAVSTDAEICARSYRNITDEYIPTPPLFSMGQTNYATAFCCALKHARLPVHAYEFNAGLVRALETVDCERAWLAGEDIFSGVQRDSAGDFFADGPVRWMYTHAFQVAPAADVQ
jgi:Fe-S-cluster containining protein